MDQAPKLQAMVPGGRSLNLVSTARLISMKYRVRSASEVPCGAPVSDGSRGRSVAEAASSVPPLRLSSTSSTCPRSNVLANLAGSSAVAGNTGTMPLSFASSLLTT